MKNKYPACMRRCPKRGEQKVNKMGLSVWLDTVGHMSTKENEVANELSC